MKHKRKWFRKPRKFVVFIQTEDGFHQTSLRENKFIPITKSCSELGNHIISKYKDVNSYTFYEIK